MVPGGATGPGRSRTVRPGTVPSTSIVDGPPTAEHVSEQRRTPWPTFESQIKRNRQNERRRLRNKSVRSEIRTRTKTAVTAIEAGAEDAAEAIRAAVRRIDKAAAKGVIHKNQAANRKSRLMRRANAAERGLSLRTVRRDAPVAGGRDATSTPVAAPSRLRRADQHLEHRLRRQGAAAPDVEIGLGQQASRPG